MNVASSQPASGQGLHGVQDARNSAASGDPASLTASGADEPIGVTACFQSGSPASYTGLQTAASYAQAASGYIGRVGEILHQMAGLSAAAQDATGDAKAGANVDFVAAQEDLTAIVGGPSAQGAAFDGSEIFGPDSGSKTVATGVSSQPSIALGAGALNLRRGALLSLVAQDAPGAFVLGASDSAAPAAISGALSQTSAASAALGGIQAQVDAASAEMPVGEANAASAVLTASQAVAASTSAATAILSLRAAAAGAYAGLPSASSVGVLLAV
jgi:hypothetical protein